MMKKVLIISAAVMMAGMSLGVMAQQQPLPCAMPDCPAATSNFDGNWQGRGPGYGSRHHRGQGQCGGMLSGPMKGGYMWRDLNLTDEQIARISEIHQQQRQETHNKIRNVLTPEQQAIFDQRIQTQQWRGEPPAAQ